MKTGKIISFLASALSAMLVLNSCAEEIIGTLEIGADEVLLDCQAGTVEIPVESNMEWRLDFKEADGKWFETDVFGGPASRKSFHVIYERNDSDSERFCDIRVFTTDADASKTIRLKQMPREPYIRLRIHDAELLSKGGLSEYDVESNVPETDILIECIETGSENPVSWISEVRLANDRIHGMRLGFSAAANQTGADRSARIRLSSEDVYGRRAEAVLAVKQPFSKFGYGMTGITLSEAVSYPAGPITDKVYVEGIVVADGKSANLPENTYVIQDNDSHSLVFRSDKALPFAMLRSFVRLGLTGCRVVEEKEGAWTYRLIEGISADNVIEETAGSLAVPEMHIADLTPEMAFTMVRLLDVEIASPHGTFTNFKTCTPADYCTGHPYFYAEKYPSYYRYYPTCIRDRQGDHCYMLVNLYAPYAYDVLPLGSGSVTGLVTRVFLSNFDINENQLCITPLVRSQIELDPSVNNVSELYLEWDCDLAGRIKEELNGRDDVPGYVYRPTFVAPGHESMMETARLDKRGNDAFGRWDDDWRIGFQDEFRGNNGCFGDSWWQGRIEAGALTAAKWEWDGRFYFIDGVSTEGVSGIMSLQVEMNGSWDVNTEDTYFVVEWSEAGNALDDGNEWKPVPDGRFKVLGQFDRGDDIPNERQKENNIPGYKVYDFKLPAEICNKPEIAIRIRIDQGYRDGLTIRIANLSLKVNK